MHWLAVAAATAAAPAAPASPQAREGVLIYEPAFFSQAQPVTALDMVSRVPGFVLDDGGDARGFGGVAGNVLIDGERPSTKSESLQTILLRIPAAGVARLELIRGATAGLDLAGQPVVVNVVRSQDKTWDAVVTQETRFFDTAVRPNGRVTGSWRTGPNTYNGELFFYSEERTVDAVEQRFTPLGELARTEIEPVTQPYWEASALAGWRRKLDNGGAVSGRFTGRGYLYKEFSDLEILDPAGALTERQFSAYREQDRRAEISFDYETPLSEKTQFKLVALQSLARNQGSSGFEEQIGAPDFARSLFRFETLSGESVIRGAFTLKPIEKWVIETGLEGAYNFLESDVGLEVGDETGLIPQPLPSSDVRVAEGRGEAFGKATITLSPQLTLETGLRVEASTIRQSGDTKLARFFVFPKPRTLLTWSPVKGRQFRFRAEREVGQLDFDDFVTSTSLIDDLVDAGNPELEPDRTWAFDVAYEQRWGEKGSATLTLGYDDLQAVADLLPVLGQFDAPGNIGAGRRYRAALEANIPLDFLGLRGAVLEPEISWRGSQVTDPTTGQDRRLTDERNYDLEVEYRHDLEKLRSTFNFFIFYGGRREAFRIVEEQTRTFSPYAEVSYEYKGIRNTSIRLAVSNLLNEKFTRERLIFPGPRNLNEPNRFDLRVAKEGMFGLVRVRRTF